MTSSPQIPHNLQKAQRIPGIGYRIGLDGIIGLIPGIGDVITVAIAARIVHLGHKMGMPKALISKMLRNIVLDFLLGAVPLVGDVADFFFKANKRNVKAMEKWWLSQNEQDLRSNTSAQLDDWERSQRT